MTTTTTPPPVIKTINGIPPETVDRILNNPLAIVRELNNRSFYHFLKTMWLAISNDTFVDNWHIKYLCNELQKMVENVGKRNPKQYDLIINIPPGSTKTIICSIAFPAWTWTRYYWVRFITASYSAALSLESAEYSRDLITSDLFRAIYPEIAIKDDKNTKSNFKVVLKKTEYPGHAPRLLHGGNRFSTSVGGSVTGFHGHVLIWDDLIDPNKAVSEVQLNTTNEWLSKTFLTRKTDKNTSVMIGIMQRLHENDPTGFLLSKGKENLKHICIPGEINNYRDKVRPVELIRNYTKDGLFDPLRFSRQILEELEIDLGQYGYAGQVGQSPTPPKGGMFKVDHFQVLTTHLTAASYEDTVRYWDKAGTADGGAYTTGVKVGILKNRKVVVLDVRRGQWSTEEREAIIRETAEADGRDVTVLIEQEPGSGGKESAENTIRNLAGFMCQVDLPKGDKVYRADPLSVQVNNGNVLLTGAVWNNNFIEEFRFFPFGKYKDQVDATSAAYNYLSKGQYVESLLRTKRK